MDNELIYDVKIVSLQTGYSERRIREFLAKGILKGKQPDGRGCKWLIKKSAVDEFTKAGNAPECKAQQEVLEHQEKSTPDSPEIAFAEQTNEQADLQDPLVADALIQHYNDLRSVVKKLHSTIQTVFQEVSYDLAGVNKFEYVQVNNSDFWNVNRNWGSIIVQDGRKATISLNIETDYLFAFLKQHLQQEGVWPVYDNWKEVTQQFIFSCFDAHKAVDSRQPDGMILFTALENLLEKLEVIFARRIFNQSRCDACPSYGTAKITNGEDLHSNVDSNVLRKIVIKD